MHEHRFEPIGELEKELSRTYDRIAQDYNAHSHETLRNFEFLTMTFLEDKLLPRMKSGQLVLDLGGGRGYVAQRLAKLGSLVLLGDISRQMLNYTMMELGDLVNFSRLSAFRLPFQPGVFDVVLTLLCEGYLRREAVAEIHRVLKLGGFYVVTQTPKESARASQQQKAVPPDRIWFERADGDVVLLPFSYVYTLDELTSLLTEHGFAILNEETLIPGELVPLERLSAVNRGIARRLGSSHKEIPLLSALIASKTPGGAGSV